VSRRRRLGGSKRYALHAPIQRRLRLKEYVNDAIDYPAALTGHRMPIPLYGIKNCDTMKKARAWLDKRGVDYAFHDYKTAGIERARLEQWAKQVGWETLLNRAGTTFRKLPDKDQNGLDAKKAIALMLAQPSMIKRPVLDFGRGKLLVGFAPETYGAAIGQR
jgi:arsenate reductase (glutaredoxin)